MGSLGKQMEWKCSKQRPWRGRRIQIGRLVLSAKPPGLGWTQDRDMCVLMIPSGLDYEFSITRNVKIPAAGMHTTEGLRLYSYGDLDVRTWCVCAIPHGRGGWVGGRSSMCQ